MYDFINPSIDINFPVFTVVYVVCSPIQLANQGTATPTNYNVIYNNHSAPTSKMYQSPDVLQRTTFALTHLYFNWCGTIRVPAPVQYAHKCAFLLGQCGGRVKIADRIKENLFYL